MLGVVRTRRQSHENAIPSYVRVRLSGHSGLNRMMRYGTSVEWNGDGGSRTYAEQAGRQACVWAASEAWQAQAQRKHSASRLRSATTMTRGLHDLFAGISCPLNEAYAAWLHEVLLCFPR